MFASVSTKFLKILQISVDIEASVCYNVFTRSTEQHKENNHREVSRNVQGRFFHTVCEGTPVFPAVAFDYFVSSFRIASTTAVISGQNDLMREASAMAVVIQ